jgi:nucleotide-binding universal stress UspA family protein
MATHGHTSVQRFLLGSVTSKVVRAVSCPVFVVPSRS